MEEEKIEHSETVLEEGSSKTGNQGNTKTDSPAKRWCFTYNNPEEGHEVLLCRGFASLAEDYIFSLETGENGTPHFQGYVVWLCRKKLSTIRNQLSKLSVRLGNNIHWEKAGGGPKSNIAYITKEPGVKVWSTYVWERKLDWPKEWHPWQREILDYVEDPTIDKRHIVWYWEDIGNVGKTTLVNYLVAERNALLLPNKTSDAMFMIGKRIDAYKSIDVCLFDVPRTNENWLNYSLIEKIKDGQIVSGKYEGCCAIIPHPKIIIFANFPPPIEVMSADRWVIKKIVV